MLATVTLNVFKLKFLFFAKDPISNLYLQIFCFMLCHINLPKFKTPGIWLVLQSHARMNRYTGQYLSNVFVMGLIWHLWLVKLPLLFSLLPCFPLIIYVLKNRLHLDQEHTDKSCYLSGVSSHPLSSYFHSKKFVFFYLQFIK